MDHIFQLIDDKKALNEKCEKLLMEMKQSDSKYQKKIKTMAETHHAELQKVWNFIRNEVNVNMLQFLIEK